MLRTWFIRFAGLVGSDGLRGIRLCRGFVGLGSWVLGCWFVGLGSGRVWGVGWYWGQGSGDFALCAVCCRWIGFSWMSVGLAGLSLRGLGLLDFFAIVEVRGFRLDLVPWNPALPGLLGVGSGVLDGDRVGWGFRLLWGWVRGG